MILNYSLLAIGITFGVFGQLAIKQGVLTLKVKYGEGLGFFIGALTNVFVFIGVALYGMSTVIWLFILSRVDLSIAYPTVSAGYIMVVLLSRVFFKEEVTVVRWAGVLVISAGVILVTCFA